MEYDYKILEDKFKQLPEEIQAALTSVEITQKIKEIADKNGLRVDQESVLFDQTSYVMLGLMPSKDFASEFAKETGVSSETATTIARDINDQVFGQIRSVMQSNQNKESASQTNTSDLSALEQVGDFTIEKEPQEGIPGDVIESQSDLIAGIENPQPAIPRPLETKPVDIETHVDPIADHLLANPVVTTETKTIRKEAPATSAPTPIKTAPQKTTNDSYREPIE